MNKTDSKIQFIKQEWLTFTLNPTEKITILLNVKDVIHCCYHAGILFTQYNHKILLTHWEIQENIERFIKNLDLAINNQLVLSSELNQDIGYAWNFICKKKNINDEYSDETFDERAKLTPYQVFSDHNFATWIYNDFDGNIILKITPLFPKGKPRNRIAKYHTFLHWMKKYKPKIRTVIPKGVAMKWLEQAQQINDIVKNNIHEIFKNESDNNLTNQKEL